MSTKLFISISGFSGSRYLIFGHFSGFFGIIWGVFQGPDIHFSDRLENLKIMNMTKINNQCDDKAIFRVFRVPMRENRQNSGFSGSHLLISGF